MLRHGRPYANLAVYLPHEDMLMRDRLPDEQRTPGAVFEWEMRQVAVPAETEGYHPLWVSETFLRKAEVVDGQIDVGDVTLRRRCTWTCEWLDAGALEEVVRLARDGAKIVLKRMPALPGMRRHPQYAGWLAELARLPNVRGALRRPGRCGRWSQGRSAALLGAGGRPRAADLLRAPAGARGPLPDGVRPVVLRGPVERTVTIHYGEVAREVTLRFEPNQSIMLRLTRDGEIGVLDLWTIARPTIPRAHS